MINQTSFADIKPMWDHAAMQNSLQAPFYTYAWHKDWYEILAHDWQPLSLVIDNHTIAPFAQKNTHVIFSGGEEIADYLDIIGPDDKKIAAWEQILPYLETKGITQLVLRNIPEDSLTLTFFQNQPKAEIVKEDTTPKLSLSGVSWETYKESLGRKYKHELERKLRKVQREHPDAQIIQSSNPVSDMSAFFQLMQKDEAKKHFLAPDIQLFFTKIAQTFSQHISLLFVVLGDKKIATTCSFVFNHTYFLYNSGFDKDCCANAGFYLKAMSIQQAIEKGLKEYNFLQGSERYKYELGAEDFGIYTITYRF